MAQAEGLVAGLRDLLGGDLIGAYLHGSEVLGGGGPHSDLDVIAVARRRTTAAEKIRLLELCRSVSLEPRPLEFDFVVASEIRPWRHPAPYDFHFSESNTAQCGTNTDLAAVVTMALAGNRALYGPPPADVFDPVPRADYHDAILRDADDPLRPHTPNTILTLARVWAGLSSDRVHSKESAAAWALERLPPDHRAVLERAVAVYRGEEQDRWDDVWHDVEAYGRHVSAEIQKAISTAST